LIAYREGELLRHKEITAHLADCANCRKELERTNAVLAALDALPVEDPGADYGRRVWQQIAPRLAEKPGRSWYWLLGSREAAGWFVSRRWAAVGSVAVLVVAAFIAGRWTKHPAAGTETLDAARVRERVLVVAVGEHLGRSEMVLVELSNAEPKGGKQKAVNIAAEQRRAEDLLEENRLYRQTALQEGDTALASTLDELERVLLDVANSPEEISAAQLETMQKRIEAHGILFKVRVVGKELRGQTQNTKPTPERNESGKKEGKKA
jgi:hypothetical protein